MPDWTAITGIVVSGVAGPSIAALWAVKRQARQAASAIALADRAAARSLLDEAAQANREAVSLAGVLRSRAAHMLGEPPPAPLSSRETLRSAHEDAAEDVKAFNAAAQRVDLLAHRISIMFGDHPVSYAFADLWGSVERVAHSAAAFDWSGDRQRGVAVVEEMQAAYSRLVEACNEADQARVNFLGASHEAIGVR